MNDFVVFDFFFLTFKSEKLIDHNRLIKRRKKKKQEKWKTEFRPPVLQAETLNGGIYQPISITGCNQSGVLTTSLFSLCATIVEAPIGSLTLWGFVLSSELSRDWFQKVQPLIHSLKPGISKVLLPSLDRFELLFLDLWESMHFELIHYFSMDEIFSFKVCVCYKQPCELFRFILNPLPTKFKILSPNILMKH